MSGCNDPPTDDASLSLDGNAQKGPPDDHSVSGNLFTADHPITFGRRRPGLPPKCCYTAPISTDAPVRPTRSIAALLPHPEALITLDRLSTEGCPLSPARGRPLRCPIPPIQGSAGRRISAGSQCVTDRRFGATPVGRVRSNGIGPRRCQPCP